MDFKYKGIYVYCNKCDHCSIKEKSSTEWECSEIAEITPKYSIGDNVYLAAKVNISRTKVPAVRHGRITRIEYHMYRTSPEYIYRICDDDNPDLVYERKECELYTSLDKVNNIVQKEYKTIIISKALDSIYKNVKNDIIEQATKEVDTSSEDFIKSMENIIKTKLLSEIPSKSIHEENIKELETMKQDILESIDKVIEVNKNKM